MRRELKDIAEKSSNNAFKSVVRSFSDANNHFHALAAESLGHAFKIQSEILSKTCETYISEISRVGRMFFAGYTTSTARRPELPHANLTKRLPIDGRAARLRPR
jgi:hypothetical protein